MGCSLLVDVDIDPETAACGSDQDCESSGLAGYRCVSELCVAPSGCTSNADCQMEGPGFECGSDGTCFDPRWSCLGSVPEPMGNTTEPVLRQRFVEITSQMVPPDLTVNLCQNSDVECRFPVARGLRPRPNGVVTATVPAAFEGFAEVESTIISPSLVHFSRPIVEDVKESDVLSLQLLPMGFAPLVAMSVGETLDPSRAILLVGTRDCRRQRAAGAIVTTAESDGETRVYYIDGDQPVPSADRTFASGNAVVLNHPPGFTTINVTRASDSQPIASRTIIARAGFINYIELPPTPLPSS